MARNWTNISLEATPTYADALAELASRRGVKKGTLVRQALDTVYGDELNAITASFFRSSVASIEHSIDKSNELGSVDQPTAQPTTAEPIHTERA
jgi:hypothetical protein